MTQYLISLSSFILIFLIIRFFFKGFKSKLFKKHQKFAGKKSVPLIGGILIFCYLCVNFDYFDNHFLFFAFFVLLIGILSDKDYLAAPKIRLILQSLVLGTFVYISDLNISDLRDNFLNSLLLNDFVKFFFVTFCLLVLVNGSNFIDGLDGLNLGYFSCISLIILLLNLSLKISFDQDLMILIFLAIFSLFLLNLFNFLYLGDSGAYLVGFLFGTILIEIYDTNSLISPYFIALLLWYPAFENLFSIIRKKLVQKDPLNPDNLHLHQLLFNLLNSQNNKFLNKYSNCISSFMITFYNMMIFSISINFINETRILLALIIFNIFIYLFTYSFLKKKLI